MRSRLIVAVSALALVSPAAMAQASGAGGADAGADLGVDLGAGAQVEGGAEAGAGTGLDIGATVESATDAVTDAAEDAVSAVTGTAETTAEAGADATAGAAAGILSEINPEDLVGLPVQSTDGAQIGEVAEVAAGASGTSQVLVATGGFLGIGAKTIALDPAMLTLDAETETVVVNMTEDELKAMPEYEG